MYTVLLVFCLAPFVDPFPQFGFYGGETSFGNNRASYQKESSRAGPISRRETLSPRSGFGTSVSNQEIRNQLCPGVNGATENIRFDRKTRKCYEIGRRGPCSENMIFYGVLHNDVYGECDCSYSTIPKPLVYHPETKKCYFVYEQAYCRNPKEWLAFNRDGTAECSLRTCPTSGVPLHGNGPCVELNQPSDMCQGTDELVAFTAGVLTPQCVKEKLLTRALSLTRKLECRTGTFLSFSGKCSAHYVW